MAGGTHAQRKQSARPAPTLFDGLGSGTIQERFERFDAAHPDVYELFKRFALELRGSGRKRGGAKAIAERIRWHYATSTGDEDFRLNNVFVSRLVRKLIAECPEEFGDFFETRTLKSA